MADPISTDTFSHPWQRFSRALPWLVLLASLSITLQLWQGARQDAMQNLQTVFDARVREITGHLEQRMRVYEQVLRGAQGLFSASNNVGREAFRIYVEQQLLEQNYPGIQGLGFSLIVHPSQKDQHIAAIRKEVRTDGHAYTIHPAGKRDLYTSVIFIEPFNWRNQRAFGYDMYTDLEHPRDGDSAPGMRRAAMQIARDSGTATISGKIRLLMETAENVQAGFLMYLPVYRKGLPHRTVAERRANIVGWVYAPFRADDLMGGLLGEQGSEFDLEVYDGESISSSTLMHDSTRDHRRRHLSEFQSLRRVKIAGRPWTVSIRSRSVFDAQLDTYKQRFIAFGGVTTSLLLALLTWLLVRGRERAMHAALKMNKKLVRSQASLNAMLDNLPYLTWLKDTKGRFIAVNQTFLKTTNKQHLHEVLGKTDLDLWPSELAEKYRADDAEVIRTRKQKSVTERSIMENGRVAWVDTFKSPIIDENGKLLGTAGVAQDITERIRIQQSIERISLLYKMQSEMNSANIHIRERSQLFETACRIAIESGLFRMAWVGLLDRDSGDIKPVAHAGHVDGYLEGLELNIFDDARGNGPTCTAIKSGTFVPCNDIANDPRMAPWRDEALKRGYRASIVCPLKQSGSVIGAFSLYLQDAGLLTDDVIQLLGNLTEDISFALDFIAESKQREQAQNDLRELSIFLQSALENERKRIARELHDELGQTMTALHFDLKWLHEHIGTQEHGLQNRLSSMQDLLGRTVDTVRRISEDLRPGMLDDLGLAAAIEHHVEKFSAQTGIACELVIGNAEHDLDEPVATALFRIVQESLTNVARHSGANRVTIRLQDLGDIMLLIVQDNGCGLPAGEAPGLKPARKTYGLLGMRERVKVLGGTLDIFNEAGAGLRIEACVPKNPKVRQ